MRLVDLKVGSVEDRWSALKLPIRKIASLKKRGTAMNGRLLVKAIVLGTLVCGTLDILWAVILTLWRGREPAAMLRGVASGLFPDATDWGMGGVILGLAVHFALMAVIVALFVLTAGRYPAVLDRPWLSGLVYGLISYIVMNLVVVPLRFPAAWPPTALSIATQLFAHIVLVGWPTAFISRAYMRG